MRACPKTFLKRLHVRPTKLATLLVNMLALVIPADLLPSNCNRAFAQSDPTLWTEKALYEARNWMPRASDTAPLDRTGKSNVSLTTTQSRPARASYRKTIQRVNLAELKAKIAAQIGIDRLVKPGRPANSIAPMGLRHVGAKYGLGGGNLEGAGFSARSPREALAACSYSRYGYPVLYQGVAKGRDGYFAYKIYRR